MKKSAMGARSFLYEIVMVFITVMYIMTELENWMCCFLWTQLNTYFSPSSLPNLSEAHNFCAANTNMVLNFPKLERHILVWKAFYAIAPDAGFILMSAFGYMPCSKT